MTTSNNDRVSIVTSLYRSAPYIEEFYSRHVRCLEEIGLDFEFVFVNDGSPDNSREVVLNLIKHDKRVILVDLSRNFGQHPAMFAAMEHATGAYVCALDCDLEEDPENLRGMYNLLKNDPDADVVYGVIAERSGGFIRGFLGRIFFLVMELLSHLKIPPNQAWQRLMTKRYVDALLLFRETETLPAGLMMLAGFKQIPFTIDKKYKGSTSYSFRKRMTFAVNSITAFSSRPLIFICLLGLAITCISFLAIVVVIGKKVFGQNYQVGWASLISSIWCVGGLLLMSIGTVGLYLARVFNQVKGRPLYVVRSVTGRCPW